MLVIIISGGSGSRLWPVSRIADPKPFLKLSDGTSLLQKTFLRALSLAQPSVPIKSVITVTNDKLHFRMQDEYQQVKHLKSKRQFKEEDQKENQDNNTQELVCDFILEPFGRNTAPAIVSACLFASKQGYSLNEPMLILPADHLITDEEAFVIAVENALKMANSGYLVTFGVKPEYAETGYGYIEIDKSQHIGAGYLVKRFSEKPNKETANKYIQSSDYLWNSGMFCATLGTLLAEFQLHAHTMYQATMNCLEHSKVDVLNDSSIVHLNANYFRHLANISIDYAICEKSNKTAVIPCAIGWSDIGSWLSIAQTLPKDQQNNAIIGESILHDTKNCLIYSTNRIVATADVNDLIIVDTPDALLVANKEQAQSVKHIFERLKHMEHKTSELHQRAHRPWGTYTVLEEGPFYKIKRIEVKPGASLSLQSHKRRSEHWVIVEGVATVTNGEQVIKLAANQSTYIPLNTKHRLENHTEEGLVLIEIQCGDYLGEDDIVRYEDKYGRSQ